MINFNLYICILYHRTEEKKSGRKEKRTQRNAASLRGLCEWQGRGSKAPALQLLFILGRNLIGLAFAVQRFFQGVPCQHGALDTGGDVGDALQSGNILQIVQLLRRDLALDHLEIQADEAVRILDGAALDQVDHQRSRRLGDRAAGANETGVLNFAVLHAQLQRDIVAAAGVHALQAVGRPLDRVAVLLAAAVLGNDLGWATLARDYGAPISVISAGLGHTSEEMTRVYLKDFDVSMLNQVNSMVTNLSK